MKRFLGLIAVTCGVLLLVGAATAHGGGGYGPGRGGGMGPGTMGGRGWGVKAMSVRDGRRPPTQ